MAFTHCVTINWCLSDIQGLACWHQRPYWTLGDPNRLKFINTVKFYCISGPQDLYPGGGAGGPADPCAPSDIPAGHVAAGTLASGARPGGSRAGRDGTARSAPPAPSDGRSCSAPPPPPPSQPLRQLAARSLFPEKALSLHQIPDAGAREGVSVQYVPHQGP